MRVVGSSQPLPKRTASLIEKETLKKRISINECRMSNIERPTSNNVFYLLKLSDCMEKTEDGTLKMTISLPDEAFLDNMARSLAQMVNAGRQN